MVCPLGTHASLCACAPTLVHTASFALSIQTPPLLVCAYNWVVECMIVFQRVIKVLVTRQRRQSTPTCGESQTIPMLPRCESGEQRDTAFSFYMCSKHFCLAIFMIELNSPQHATNLCPCTEKAWAPMMVVMMMMHVRIYLVSSQHSHCTSRVVRTQITAPLLCGCINAPVPHETWRCDEPSAVHRHERAWGSERAESSKHGHCHHRHSCSWHLPELHGGSSYIRVFCS